VIPIVVDDSYPKTGWLSMLIAGQLRYFISSQDQVEVEVKKILKKELIIPGGNSPTTPTRPSPESRAKSTTSSKASLRAGGSRNAPNSEEEINCWLRDIHVEVDLVKQGFCKAVDLEALLDVGDVSQLKSLLNIEKPLDAVRLYKTLRKTFSR